MILTGRAVAAIEAHRMDPVNRLADVGQARSEAEALAHHLAAFPQECLRRDRSSTHE